MQLAALASAADPSELTPEEALVAWRSAEPVALTAHACC